MLPASALLPVVAISNSNDDDDDDDDDKNPFALAGIGDVTGLHVPLGDKSDDIDKL